tara:strand:- start:211 stop:477 length:267 start_codon:yes stop_codon:yes gene_type:complete
MCIGPFKPKAPKLPEKTETAPRPEKTASAPTIGSKRKGVTKPDRTAGSTSEVGSTVSTSSPRRSLFARRRGTASLRIPLTSSGNLNYG